jgi:hypothetical protein
LMGVVASALHRLADAVAPPEELMAMPPGLHWTNDADRREARHDMALSMLDDETAAVVVVMVRDRETRMEVIVGGEVRDELWPPIAQTLMLLQKEARRV